MEELLGGQAIVDNDFDHTGTVTIHSEHWSAVTEQPLHKGQAVQVTGIKGLILQVSPMEDIKQEESS